MALNIDTMANGTNIGPVTDPAQALVDAGATMVAAVDYSSGIQASGRYGPWIVSLNAAGLFRKAR